MQSGKAGLKAQQGRYQSRVRSVIRQATQQKWKNSINVPVAMKFDGNFGVRPVAPTVQRCLPFSPLDGDGLLPFEL